MSKEDVYAYTKLLKFQKKRYGASLFDILFIGLSLTIIFFLTVIVIQRANSFFATLLFIITTIYIIFFLLAFSDYVIGLGLFQTAGLYFASGLFLLSVFISAIVSLDAANVFNNHKQRDLLATLVLVYTFFGSVVTSYYLTTKSPSREGRDEMITKLTEIRRDIDKLPLSSLGSVSSEERALKWIKFKQRSDGIWGENNPLLETAEVMNMFYLSGKGLKYSWKSIIKGVEETHNVEQTYYLILEALDTANLEPTHESLLPLLIIGEIDSETISLDHELFEDFNENLYQYSEWEFVKDIERYDEVNERNSEIPLIFVMAQLFHLKGNFEVAQKCADIIANTFGILINRSATRFNVVQDKEISSRILGLMYNTLMRLVRGKQGKATLDKNEDNFSLDLGTTIAPDVDEDDNFGFDLPDISTNDQVGEDMPSLPGFDMDFDNMAASLPDMSIQDEVDNQSEKIKIGTSLANIRNFIRSKQQIDGSWGGRIDITAECLRSVSDRESAENEFIKAGIHYLLALQEKNGSWQDDAILTSKVISILSKINRGLSVTSLLDQY